MEINNEPPSKKEATLDTITKSSTNEDKVGTMKSNINTKSVSVRKHVTCKKSLLSRIKESIRSVFRGSTDPVIPPVSRESEICIAVKGYDQSTDKCRYLEDLIKNDELDVIKAIYQLDKRSIKVKGCINYTLLHIATYYDNVEAVRFLIDHGVDVNNVTSSGKTALHYAANNNSSNALRYLIENHPQLIHVKNSDKQTVYKCAFNSNNRNIIQIFHEMGYFEEVYPSSLWMERYEQRLHKLFIEAVEGVNNSDKPKIDFYYDTMMGRLYFDSISLHHVQKVYNK